MWRSSTGFPWRDTWQRPWQKAEEREKKTKQNKPLLLTGFHDNTLSMQINISNSKCKNPTIYMKKKDLKY